MAHTQSATAPVAARPLRGSHRPTVHVVVTPEIKQFFADATIVGHGGFQSLCRTLSEQLRDSNILRLQPSDFKRIVRYATIYGEGGFQQRLRKIVATWVNQHFDELVGG
jgi:hypothetical protein